MDKLESELLAGSRKASSQFPQYLMKAMFGWAKLVAFLTGRSDIHRRLMHHGNRLYFFIQPRTKVILCRFQVIKRLQIKPKLWRGVSSPCQPQRGIAGNAAASSHDLVQPSSCNV